MVNNMSRFCFFCEKHGILNFMDLKPPEIRSPLPIHPVCRYCLRICKIVEYWKEGRKIFYKIKD